MIKVRIYSFLLFLFLHLPCYGVDKITVDPCLLSRMASFSNVFSHRDSVLKALETYKTRDELDWDKEDKALETLQGRHAMYVQYEHRIARDLASDLARRSYQFREGQMRAIGDNKRFLEEKVKSGEIYKVFQYRDQPIFHLKFENLYLRGLATDRMVFYVEKGGRNILSDQELHKSMAQLGPGAGNDLRLSDIADFFSKAEAKKIKLNPMEIRLKEELLNANLLSKIGDSQYKNASQAALLFSDSDSRIAVADHELNHGIYFTDSKYQQAVSGLWKSLTPSDREFATRIMSTAESYDVKDQDLMAREFAAYFKDPETLKDYNSASKTSNKDFEKILVLSKRVKKLDQESAYYRTTTSSN